MALILAKSLEICLDKEKKILKLYYQTKEHNESCRTALEILLRFFLFVIIYAPIKFISISNTIQKEFHIK